MYDCKNNCGKFVHLKGSECPACLLGVFKAPVVSSVKCGTCGNELAPTDFPYCNLNCAYAAGFDDYGKKIEAPQQSARHNSGKTQVREVDPAFILGLGEVLTASREKYDEGNWQKETKFSTPYESAMRHLMKFWAGEEFDEETSKHHLLHAATNLMFLYYHTRSDVGIDDRLFKKVKK